MNEIRDLFFNARNGDDEAFEKLVERFKPLLRKASMRSGKFDEDCYQECLIAFHKSLKKFDMRN